MATDNTRRSLLRKTVYTGLAAGAAALSYGTYSLFRRRPIDELYGAYPSAESLQAVKLEDASAPKPNVIVIYCDDLGYGDIGCYGNKVIRTPNIDRLANDGIKFSDYYACSAVCAPSRAGLLTGRYPFRSGMIGNPYPADEPMKEVLARKLAVELTALGAADLHEEYTAEGLSRREITLATMLKTAGYRTGMIGKWHLGDYSRQVEFNPLRHGFDSYLGTPHSNDMQPCPLFRGETLLKDDIGPMMTEITGLYTKEAVEFIASAKGKPFFLYLAHAMPHQPLAASAAFAGKSAAGKFGDAVEELDWSVGQIVKALDQQGLTKDTLIVFTSDNGPWFEGSAGDLRGRKGQSYEGGYRVPCIAKWPGQITAGGESTEPVSNLDIFPTVAKLAGVALPADRTIDGKDIFGVLSGRDPKSPHEALYFYHYATLEGVRVGKWKYFRQLNRYVWPVPLDAEKLASKLGKKQLGNRAPLLYDLSIDRGESYNVISHHATVAQQMEAAMQKWEASTALNPRGFKSLAAKG